MTFNFEAVGRVGKKRSRGMFGLVLKVPDALIGYTESAYWLIYGNACYYCRDLEKVYRICSDHGWYVSFFVKTEGENVERA